MIYIYDTLYTAFDLFSYYFGTYGGAGAGCQGEYKQKRSFLKKKKKLRGKRGAYM